MGWPGDNLRRYWAERKLTEFMKLAEEYLGERPKRVTLYAEDFDLLDGRVGDDLEMIRGNPKPKPHERVPVHR